MIEISQLREIHPVYCYSPKGDTVTFKSIRDLIKKTAKTHAVPVAFAYDEISSWNADGLVIEDCLIVYHPKHRHDYINIVFRIRRDGNNAYILKSEYGNSPLTTHTDVLSEIKQPGKPLRKIIEDDKELEAEKKYYLALRAIFEYIKC